MLVTQIGVSASRVFILDGVAGKLPTNGRHRHYGGTDRDGGLRKIGANGRSADGQTKCREIGIILHRWVTRVSRFHRRNARRSWRERGGERINGSRIAAEVTGREEEDFVL